VSNFVKLTEAASLGLHAMAMLARHEGRRITNQVIARKLHASSHHLSKVMQRLVHAGLVRSTSGPQGGFVLAKSADRITLLDIHEAVEGTVAESGPTPVPAEGGGNGSPLGTALEDANRQIRCYLAGTALAQLAGMPFMERLAPGENQPQAPGV